jgi:hypothetical protein
LLPTFADDLRFGGWIVSREPSREIELSHVANEGVVHRLPLISPHSAGIHHLPAPQIVDRLQHLERARIALGLHARDPVWIEVARTHLVGEHARRARDPQAFPKVQHVERGAASLDVPDRE